MQFGRADILLGMEVVSGDGQKLGRVVETRAEAFRVQRGRIFHHDTWVRYDEVTEIDEGILKLSRIEADWGTGRDEWSGGRNPQE